MVKIVKDLYITEIKISNISNAPFVIEAIGSYSNRFTINEEILNNWGIISSNKIIGKSLLLELKSIQPTDNDSNLIKINSESSILSNFNCISFKHSLLTNKSLIPSLTILTQKLDTPTAFTRIFTRLL